MKAPENPALSHDVNKNESVTSKNDSFGKLTRSPSLLRDCLVDHFPHNAFRKLLPPSRAKQRININTRQFDDEQKLRIVPRKMQHQQ